MSDYDKISAGDFGRGLRGLGINILTPDVTAKVAFLREVFGMSAHQPTADFAILRYGEAVFQLHSDGTYHANAYLAMLPENPPRGQGCELRLYDSDPDEAVIRAAAFPECTILHPPEDKPHGLREAIILDADGYCWIPSKGIPDL